MDKKRLIAYRLIDLFSDRRLLATGIPLSVLDHLGVLYIKAINATKSLNDIGHFIYNFLRSRITSEKIFIPHKSTAYTLVHFMDIASTHVSRILGIEVVDSVSDHADPAIKPSRRTRRGKRNTQKSKEDNSVSTLEEPVMEPSCSDDGTLVQELNQSSQSTLEIVTIEEASRKRSASEPPVTDSPPEKRTVESDKSVEVPSTTVQQPITGAFPPIDDIMVSLCSRDYGSGTKTFQMIRSGTECTSCSRVLGFATEPIMEAVGVLWCLGYDPNERDECVHFLASLTGCVIDCKTARTIRGMKSLFKKMVLVDQHFQQGCPLPPWGEEFFRRYPKFTTMIKSQQISYLH